MTNVKVDRVFFLKIHGGFEKQEDLLQEKEEKGLGALRSREGPRGDLAK